MVNIILIMGLLLASGTSVVLLTLDSETPSMSRAKTPKNRHAAFLQESLGGNKNNHLQLTGAQIMPTISYLDSQPTNETFPPIFPDQKKKPNIEPFKKDKDDPLDPTKKLKDSLKKDATEPFEVPSPIQVPVPGQSPKTSKTEQDAREDDGQQSGQQVQNDQEKQNSQDGEVLPQTSNDKAQQKKDGKNEDDQVGTNE